MPRRVRRARKADEEDGKPITISQSEREAFEAELEERSARWTEAYADIVEQLPLELQRSFSLTKELDRQSEGEKTETDIDDKNEMEVVWKQYLAARYAASNDDESSASEVKQETTSVLDSIESSDNDQKKPATNPGGPSAERQALLQRIQTLSQTTQSIAKEKIALAITAYASVDRQIRRLDSDLLKNELSLYAGIRNELAHPSTDGPNAIPLPQATDRFSPEGQLLQFWSGLVPLDTLTCLAYLKEHLGTDTPTNQPTKKQRRAQSTSQRDKHASHDTNSSTRFADTEIDPSEPRYCYCDRVSYGEMVACDNEECPREWVCQLI
ncbi:hypothetical protein MPSI1_002256 [Malassezia psittaci]|uniref:Inhibitor of growth protein N-terminal histone-binding domain-containing protein n=1 Tax=Malassezia psittaci TaxID=1821823 RepID=A0AAF0F6F5_9BASI|nr:hypothetical protein MPSI1_002256 [Malassezia psittaci]